MEPVSFQFFFTASEVSRFPEFFGRKENEDYNIRGSNRRLLQADFGIQLDELNLLMSLFFPLVGQLLQYKSHDKMKLLFFWKMAWRPATYF